MKKYILLLALVCSGLVSFSQVKRNYNIGILLDNKTPEISILIKELQREITAVIGEDATISFSSEYILSNNFNLALAESNYDELLNSSTDIILAFGVINNMIISNQVRHAKPTILFGAINKDFILIDEQKKTSGIHNFTYIVASQSFKKDLSIFKELSSFTHVGIAMEKPLLEILPLKETIDTQAKELGYTYKIIPYNTIEDIIRNLDSDMDAFYLASGFFLNDVEIKQLATRLIEKKIPSFTNTPIQDVNSGLMATNQAEENINQFFRRIALNVEAYVNGENLSELPTYINYDERLTINYNTAENVGLPIKLSLITNTNFVGDFINVLSEKKYNLLDVMHDVINNNLSLQSSKKDLALSEQELKVARSNYLPDLTANITGTHIDPDLAKISIGQNPEFSIAENLSLTQTLFSEAANANIDIKKTLVKAQQESYNSDELDAIFNASNAYFNALILKANLQIRKQNLDLTKKNLQIANQNFEAGQSGKSDVLRFRSELAQNTQAMIEGVNQLEMSYIMINQLLNNPIDYEIDVDIAELGKGIFESYDYQQLRDIIDNPKLRKSFVSFLIEEAKANAPELKYLDYNITVVKRSISLNSGGRFLPTLALQGQYNKHLEQWGKGSLPSPILNSNYNVGLNLSIPVFQQNSRNINRQTSIIQNEQLAINRSNLEQNIDANINNAVLELINEISNIEISKISEETAEEGLDLTQSAYASGAVTIVQLLDAQSNYLRAQLANISASYNYLLSSMQLERYMSYYFLLHSEEENQEFINRFLTFTANRN